MRIKLFLIALCVALAVVFGCLIQHIARAQSIEPSALKFLNVPNGINAADYSVTATKYADVPGGWREEDGQVVITTQHSFSTLRIISNAGLLKIGTPGQPGTPSAFQPIGAVPFDLRTLVVDCRNGVTKLSDGTGRTITIYGYGFAPKQPTLP